MATSFQNTKVIVRRSQSKVKILILDSLRVFRCVRNRALTSIYQTSWSDKLFKWTNGQSERHFCIVHLNINLLYSKIVHIAEILSKSRCTVQHCSIVQADSTYKLVWLGFQVLIIGITDMDKVFHPLGLTLSLEEKAEDFEFIFKSLIIEIEICQYQQLGLVNLQADAADAITNGFKKAL